jgi:phosphoesterase RecJ-like protein
MDQSKEFLKKLKEASSIVITTHKSPDGDAIGSSLALYNMLTKKGFNATVIVPDQFPDFISWMTSADEIIVQETNEELAKSKVDSADIIFCLDFNALHRIDTLGDWVGEKEAYKVMIDHHQSPDDFANWTISDTSKSSTCEMMYDFFVLLNWQDEIDAQIGECIYCGIMTDTGSFRFPSTTSATHEIIADLIKKGVDNSSVHQKVNDSNTISRIQVLGRCLNNMEYLESSKTTIFAVSLKDFEELNVKKGDTEGIVNYGLSIGDVLVSAMFKEDYDKVKISFRSKGEFDVNLFARKYFNGGGHKNAAGGMSEESLKDTIEKFKNHIKDEMDSFLGE